MHSKCLSCLLSYFDTLYITLMGMKIEQTNPCYAAYEREGMEANSKECLL